MDAGDIATTVVSSLSALIAGAALVWQFVATRPRVNGRVNRIIYQFYRDADDVFTITLMPMLTLTTMRRRPVYIMDYIVEIDRGNGFELLHRYEARPEIPPFRVGSARIEFDNWRRMLIYYPYQPVEYGAPLTGFVVRYLEIQESEIGDMSPEEFITNLENQIRFIRVTIKDSFMKVRRFTTSPKDYIDNKLFIEILETMGGNISVDETSLNELL